MQEKTQQKTETLHQKQSLRQTALQRRNNDTVNKCYIKNNITAKQSYIKKRYIKQTLHKDIYIEREI